MKLLHCMFGFVFLNLFSQMSFADNDVFEEKDYEVPRGTIIECTESSNYEWGGDVMFRGDVETYRFKKVDLEDISVEEKFMFGIFCSTAAESMSKLNFEWVGRKTRKKAGSKSSSSKNKLYELPRCYKISKKGAEPDFSLCTEIYHRIAERHHFKGLQCNNQFSPIVSDRYSIEPNGYFHKYLQPTIPLGDSRAYYSNGKCWKN